MPEPSQNWLTVAYWVGGFLAAVVAGFWGFYAKERSRARTDIERSPEIAATAVGAAFVDRTVAQAIVAMADAIKEIAGDVRAILELVRERSEREHDDRLERQVEQRILGRLGGKRRDE